MVYSVFSFFVLIISELSSIEAQQYPHIFSFTISKVLVNDRPQFLHRTSKFVETNECGQLIIKILKETDPDYTYSPWIYYLDQHRGLLGRKRRSKQWYQYKMRPDFRAQSYLPSSSQHEQPINFKIKDSKLAPILTYIGLPTLYFCQDSLDELHLYMRQNPGNACYPFYLFIIKEESSECGLDSEGV